MAPNGMTQVWSGLLLRCEDEAQLAFVLGHEIGHFRNRDTLVQWRRLKATDGWASVVGMLSLGLGAGLVGELAALAGYANVMAFSRDQERGADRDGYATAVHAGYDPGAGAELFAALLAEEQAREKNKPSSIFATHPATRERVATLRELAAQPGAFGDARGRDRFLAATRGLRMAWLRSELARRHDAQTLVLLDRLAARRDDLAPGELTYTRAEVLRRRNQDGDRAAAIALYRRAESEPGAPVEAARDLGLALRASGEVREAASAFARYLARAPQAGDHALIEHYQQELSAKSTPE
jgi:predicted Zn-dependent protease